MKKQLLALALGFSMMAPAMAADTLRVATDGTYPPFSTQTADGKLVGFDIDIANAICAEMKAKCELVRYDFDGMIPGLNAKKFDMIVASMANTPERQKAIAFSDRYQGGYYQLLGMKDKTYDGTPAGMKGKTIGVQTASIQEKFAKDTWGKAGAKIRSYKDPSQALLELQAGRIDAMMAEVGVAHEFFKAKNGDKIKLFGPKLDDPKYFGVGAGIAVRKSDKELLKKINSALATILKNGTYKKINDKYFTYNVYE